MDHYKVLGVPKNASKEEIKEAFRKLAMQFHPDKHAHSPKHLKDTATLKFKQLSEAYEILTDDCKRSDYNSGRHATSSSWNTRYHNRNYNNCGYEYAHYNYTAGKGRSSGRSVLFESVFVFLNARTLVRTATVAGVLIGGMYLVDGGVDALWNTKNSGKYAVDNVEAISSHTYSCYFVGSN